MQAFLHPVEFSSPSFWFQGVKVVHQPKWKAYSIKVLCMEQDVVTFAFKALSHFAILAAAIVLALKGIWKVKAAVK